MGKVKIGNNGNSNIIINVGSRLDYREYSIL